MKIGRTIAVSNVKLPLFILLFLHILVAFIILFYVVRIVLRLHELALSVRICVMRRHLEYQYLMNQFSLRANPHNRINGLHFEPRKLKV